MAEKSSEHKNNSIALEGLINMFLVKQRLSYEENGVWHY